MKTVVQSLPGIKKIAWIYNKNLPSRVDLKAIVGESIDILAPAFEIVFFGFPECRHVREKENHTVTESVELTFNSPAAIDNAEGKSILVQDASDQWYLIGSKEQPCAAITFERDKGSPKGGASQYSVKVSHTGIRTLVRSNVYMLELQLGL